MKLTKKQLKDLEAFAYKADTEGFDYACENYSLEDDTLHALICAPVVKAKEIYDQLKEENNIEDS